ncbi:modulator of macroautophagy TMEM150B isoform X2 [Channa argus]|uniref:modulator of macroautophagy TMEM150B isoform X2 n=1 Tax=Channa argus TaxID=215402 RepID=UPI0035223A15
MWLWALLPISLAVFGTVGIWTVFAVAVTNGSVNLTEGIPFISNCGTYNPQSCLFSQICNICSVLSLWIVVIRYQQVQDYGDHGKANIASIVLGFISSIGISVIGNFQQSVLMGIHLFGAFLAFFIGLAYFWVQLFLTYRAEPSQDRCWVGPVRALCCTFCTILVFARSCSTFLSSLRSGSCSMPLPVCVLQPQTRHRNLQRGLRSATYKKNCNENSHWRCLLVDLCCSH